MFEDLKKGEDIALIVIPPFMMQYKEKIPQIFGGLMDAGVKRFLDGACGQAITSWATINYMNDNIVTSHENTTAAESVIRDADMASEMTNYTKYNVLMQSAQSMLSQSNQNLGSSLDLLK